MLLCRERFSHPWESGAGFILLSAHREFSRDREGKHLGTPIMCEGGVEASNWSFLEGRLPVSQSACFFVRREDCFRRKDSDVRRSVTSGGVRRRSPGRLDYSASVRTGGYVSGCGYAALGQLCPARATEGGRMKAEKGGRSACSRHVVDSISPCAITAAGFCGCGTAAVMI